MAIDLTDYSNLAMKQLQPMNLEPPSARSSMSMGGGIDPVGDVQSNYLNALMGGIQAAQGRMESLKKRRAALAQSADSAMQQGAVGGQVMNAGGDWGDPIGDANFAKNYLTSIRLPNGKSILVHKNAAQNMQGFLTDLWNSGYKFSDVGSYNKRKVAGSNLWSRHSTGLALDIDPMKNPFNKNAPYALPKNAGQLAAKWGLSWLGPKNGDWMHFGVTAPQWKGLSPN